MRGRTGGPGVVGSLWGGWPWVGFWLGLMWLMSPSPLAPPLLSATPLPPLPLKHGAYGIA